MTKGKIKRFNKQNYTGEIKPDNDNQIVKFDKKAIQQKDLALIGEGDIVEFEEISGESYSRKAARVTVVTPAAQPLVPDKKIPQATKSAYKPSAPKPVKALHAGKETASKSSSGGASKAPYSFAPLRTCHKIAPEQLHDTLKEGNYDIAFDITWETLTPTAANPCKENVRDNAVEELKDDYKGYNKRWLMIDNRLAISPFTVKSAIANGFANIMGGCYRVVDRIVSHPDKVEDGHYYYTGKYKRYRVAMDGSSKPGIVSSIESLDDGSREITIQPVTEYYYDSQTPPSGISAFAKGAEYYVSYREERHRFIIAQNTIAAKQTAGLNKRVKYFGIYKYGMDLTLGPGGMKRHEHRFYEGNGKTIEGIIPAINFKSKDNLKENVYMGRFKRLDRSDRRPEGGLWYEDLNSLKKGDWIYYEEFNGRAANIGKNFQFKALFLHEDAVPETSRLCKDIKKGICPRCSMFGMTDDTKDKDKDAVGFKGRFRASALVSGKQISEEHFRDSIPVIKNGRKEMEAVDAKKWMHNGDELCRQYLLPLMGEPKPNKRDVNGYYDKTKGEIKGAKYYKHASVNISSLVSATNNLVTIGDADLPYAHNLRNYAVVCKDKEAFTGTIGAENCTEREIAALILLLDSNISNHGFKIGLGKPLGLGSVKSSIKKIWIRSKATYQWQVMDYNIDNLKKILPQLGSETQKLRNGFFNKFNGYENRSLKYPMPVQEENGRKIYYWEKFNLSE